MLLGDCVVDVGEFLITLHIFCGKKLLKRGFYTVVVSKVSVMSYHVGLFLGV